MERILLLTGRPGVGKTTALKRAGDRLDVEIAGFYTEEIREGGERKGFRAVPFGGGEAITIAHVDVDGPSVGRYGVDVGAVDRVVENALRGEPDAWMVDEIGKMEVLSDAFVERIREILDGDRPVVATIGRKGGGAIAAIRHRHDTEVWEVTRENRDAIPERIVDRVRGVLERQGPSGAPPSSRGVANDVRTSMVTRPNGRSMEVGEMAEIRVEHRGGDAYRVRVEEGDSSTEHVVTVNDEHVERFGAGAERLLEASFEFLLEREPKESILGSFELPVIARYFPEYPDEIRRRLSG